MSKELKTTLVIAALYAFRMMGLFMVVPVFSLYLNRLDHATPALIGIALGIYGLTQAIFQIPFGMSSDRLGRKPVIAFGLLLFIAGSLMAAMTDNIYLIIAGRALQGAGAIGSTLIALVADATDEKARLKSMAIIGISIGFSFLLAMMLGPLVNAFAGLSGVFYLTAGFGMVSLILLITVIPNFPLSPISLENKAFFAQLKRVLGNVHLLRLNAGIFSLHASLMAIFIALPITLVQAGLQEQQAWQLYLPVLLGAAILMSPLLRFSRKSSSSKPYFSGAIVVFALMQLILWKNHHHLYSMGVLLLLFFTAFTFLEASLPTYVSRLAPKDSKGTAMGIYSSAQFLGIFSGATLGGFCFHHFGESSLYLLGAMISFFWWLIALGNSDSQA